MKYLLISLFLVLSLVKLTAQDATSRLAWEYYNGREYDKAAPLFLRMYEENKVKTYLNYYVNCLIELTDYEAAVKIIRKNIKSTKDVAWYIDLGYVYERAGDTRLAEECYQEPLKEFPNNAAAIANLGNAYSLYLKPYYAESVYELGRKVLGDPEAFRMEMANVYASQRKFPAMLDEYIALILREPQYLPTVEALIQNTLTYDVDETLLEQTREKALANIQQLPGIAVFYELLIWVLIQENKFMEAVEQTIAMDRRRQTSPDKILQMARISAEAENFTASLVAYNHLIEKGPDPPPASAPGRMSSGGSYFRTARIEYLLIQSEKYRITPETGLMEWKSLVADFRKAIDEFSKSPESGPIYLELARIYAEDLHDASQALEVLETALALPGMNLGYRTDCLLLKGDILLKSGDPWEASFVYAMVDMENPDNPSGSEARLRRARMAWYTGSFKLAAAQLDVLKGSTSKPVANDAFELSLLIRENSNENDSAQTGLASLAHLDYLIFQGKYEEALKKADSVLLALETDEPSRDDFLYKKSEVFRLTGQTSEQIKVLEEILTVLRYEYWGHKALYELACLYQDKYQDTAKATDLFNDFMRDFPNSFYFLDVRDRLRAILLKKSL